MAFAIPRIQYKNVDTTGNTTNTNATITNIPDTSEIDVGMFVRGTGIPTGATVASKTSTTVVLTAPLVASATATGVALAFGLEILFVYPPIEDSGELLESKGTTSETISGVQQIAINYIEATRKLKFSFLSQSLYTLVDTFLRTHAMFGETFRYYEDQTTSTYVDFVLDSLKVNPKKIASRGVASYVWEVPLNFRRAL